LEFIRRPDWTERWTWWRHEPVILNANAGRWLRDILHPRHPGALLAADQMGALGYFASPNQTIIDLGGLMDRDIARRGLHPRDAVDRAPDFLVLYALLEEDEPILPELKALVRDDTFKERYAVWWELKPRAAVNGVKFLVYGKRGAESAPETPEEVLLGPDAAEFQRWWRLSIPDAAFR
jgi:hypothetical protein